MMTQTTSYDHATDHDHVDCEDQGPDPYPVLHIGNTVIWPTREQLVAIRDAIQGYLDAHPEPAPFTPEEVEKIAAGIEAEDARDRSHRNRKGAVLMTIYVMCVNPESGKTLAISADDPSLRAFSWNSGDEALGILIREQTERGIAISVDRVVVVIDGETQPIPAAPLGGLTATQHALVPGDPTRDQAMRITVTELTDAEIQEMF